VTETEWLACENPQPMQEFLRGKASDRKLRLFALACFRPYRFMLVPETLEALEVAEKLAEGTVSPGERKQARDRAIHASWNSDNTLRHSRGPAKDCVASSLGRNAYEAAVRVAFVTRHLGVMSKKDWPADAFEVTEFGPRLVDWSAGKREQEILQARLLRELFGNPFRPILPDPGWLDANVVGIARSMYEGRDFARMPLLGDALEDFGCVHEEVLDHCRGEVPHDRGCWVVDLILGKS
jgi:hypothetical protein